MYDILLRNARIPGRNGLSDIAISGETIQAVGTGLPTTALEVCDLDGGVVIPGLVETHIHLDKAFLEKKLPNRSGTLQEAITNTGILKKQYTFDDVYDRARKAVLMAITHGTSVLRAHVEVDPIAGLLNMEVVSSLRREFSECIDIQLVVFPQEGIFKSPGTVELMGEAIAFGVDAVGGVPYNDRDYKEHTDFVFKLAKEYDLDLDLHVDFSDNPADRTVEYIAERAIAEKYHGRVAVDHLTSLGSIPAAEAAGIIAMIAEAGIHVVTLPSTDLYLNGRQDTVSVRRGLTRVKELVAAGVNVVLGSNNIRNAFTPFGLADPLQIGLLLANSAHMGTLAEQAQVLDMCTYAAARMLKVKNYGLKPGCLADLVVLDTRDPDDILIDQPLRRMVLKRGKPILRQRAEVEQAHQLLRAGRSPA